MPGYRDEGFVGEFWGSAGAGILFQARSTGRYLLLKRSWQVEDPGLWGIPGGAVPVDARGQRMDLWGAARRETFEETRRRVGVRARRLGQYTWQAPGGTFRYTTFVVEVAREFTPELNWESEGSWWFTEAEIRAGRRVHPGVTWVFGRIGAGGGRAVRVPTAQEVLDSGTCVVDEEGLFFHATPTDNLDAILRGRGLRPGDGRNFQGTWGRGKVFLTSSFDRAVHWQGLIAEQTGVDVAILGVRLTPEQQKRLRVDSIARYEGDSCSFYVRRGIPRVQLGVADTGSGTAAFFRDLEGLPWWDRIGKRPGGRSGGRAGAKGHLGRRLDWIEATWSVDLDDPHYSGFLYWLWQTGDWGDGFEHNLHAPTAARRRLREVLGASPPRPADKLVPWVWREYLRTRSQADPLHADPVPPNAWPLVRDWALATRPDLHRLSWAEAYGAAVDYHDDLEERQDRKKWVKAWQRNKARALTSFRRVLTFEDGVWLGYFDHNVQGLASLQMVGALLRHCYVDANNAIHYGGWDRGGGGILVLFGPDDEPAVSLAYREPGPGADSVVFEEVRGVQNRFPARRWWPYVARVLFGDETEARRFEEVPSWAFVSRMPDGRVRFQDGDGPDSPVNLELFFHADEIDPGWTYEDQLAALRAEGWASVFMKGSSYDGSISRRAWWF